MRNVLVPSESKVQRKHPWLKFPNMKGSQFSNAMFAKVLSIHGDKGASMFTNITGFNYVYPWKSKKQHPEALPLFIHDVGIPQMIGFHGGKELYQGTYHIHQKLTVLYSLWKNAAKVSICENKKFT